MSAARTLALLLALGTLAGCNGKDATAPGGKAEGEVLPGSISDAMLPYDTATSAPPLEAPEAASGPVGSASEAAGNEAVVGDVESEPEPAAT